MEQEFVHSRQSTSRAQCSQPFHPLLWAVSSWPRWPSWLGVPCSVLSVQFQKLRDVFYQFTMDRMEGFGGTFYIPQNHQTLSNPYEDQFLNLQGQLCLWGRWDAGVAWPEHWFSGESGKPFCSRVDGKYRVCPGGLLLQQGSWMHPSFLRKKGSLVRPGHPFTCPAEKHRQILIFGLSFSMGTSILLLWHYHRLIWLISAQFISDYLFF